MNVDAVDSGVSMRQAGRHNLTAAEAREKFRSGGGLLYPFRHGYESLSEILQALPDDEWRRDEAVLGGLVLFLVKQGQAVRAKSYHTAVSVEFEKTFQFVILDLLIALHLGEPVSDKKLTEWRRLERVLPWSEPLLQGMYHNAMMAMFVRLGRLEDARVAGQQAISCYREDGHVYLEHFIYIHLADLDVIEGRLRRAARGLRSAERCLEASGVRYGNEEQVIDVIWLAIDYERGQLKRVREKAAFLRSSLMNGDSWSELFCQLARIGVMSTYFLEGRLAAARELEAYQADYARRHSGAPSVLDVLDARLSHLEWQPNEAERLVQSVSKAPIQSAVGNVVFEELKSALQIDDTILRDTPRGVIVRTLQEAHRTRGKTRRDALVQAMRLALEERQIAPFLEHRDAFLGVSTGLGAGRIPRGNAALTRLARQVTSLVEDSYVVPEPLRAIGFNLRQYRVAAALLSGASNKQVARQLGTTEATVKYHLTSIYRMAGVSKRSQFIEYMSESEFSGNS